MPMHSQSLTIPFAAPPFPVAVGMPRSTWEKEKPLADKKTREKNIFFIIDLNKNKLIFLFYFCSMRFLTIIFFPVVLFFSCGESKTETIPAAVLPKEKMANVLAHIHIAQAEISMQPGSDSLKAEQFQKIFEKDSITKQQYEESLSFYIEHPQLFNKVYEEVINELSKMQAQAK
jgi:hypothetical protein